MRTFNFAQLKVNLSSRNYGKYCIAIILSLFALFVLAPLTTYHYFKLKTQIHIYESPAEVPQIETALVLGTSKYTKNKSLNQFFDNRMKAAQILYGYHKVNKILLSGDHQNKNYNEPLAMKVSLQAEGVPEDIMVLDPAGLRTFDSVIRACQIYNQHDIVIVSQRFHLERALFIAHSQGVKACGFVAEDSDDEYANLRLHIREGYARMLTLWDVYGANA